MTNSSSINWRNRIVRYGEQPANQFLANPANPRRHPTAQREALRGSFDALGIIAPVLVSSVTGYVVDGHARIEECLSRNDEMLIPFIEVDLSEDEEALALVSFDWITQMAYYDKDALNSLLDDVNTDSEALQSLLSDLAEKQGVIPPTGDDWSNAFDGLPTEDRAPFQQMTFTLHDTQADLVKRAMTAANAQGDYSGPNENGNGNALARICEAYLNGTR